MREHLLCFFYWIKFMKKSGYICFINPFPVPKNKSLIFLWRGIMNEEVLSYGGKTPLWRRKWRNIQAFPYMFQQFWHLLSTNILSRCRKSMNFWNSEWNESSRGKKANWILYLFFLEWPFFYSVKLWLLLLLSCPAPPQPQLKQGH